MNKLAINIGKEFFGRWHFLGKLEGLGSLVSILLSNAILIAGIVFLFITIIAGLDMISAAGSGDPQRVARGHQIIIAAIIGFIIVVASYWIVLIIGKSTGLKLLQ